MKLLKLLSPIFALWVCSTAKTAPPEQMAREFSQSLTDQSVKLRTVLDAFLDKSPRYYANPELWAHTESALVSVLSGKAPLSHPHMISHKELAPDVARIVVALDTSKGPVFLKFIYYRVSNSPDDWGLISADASEDPEVFLR